MKSYSSILCFNTQSLSRSQRPTVNHSVNLWASALNGPGPTSKRGRLSKEFGEVHLVTQACVLNKSINKSSNETLYGP